MEVLHRDCLFSAFSSDFPFFHIDPLRAILMIPDGHDPFFAKPLFTLFPAMGPFLRTTLPRRFEFVFSGQAPSPFFKTVALQRGEFSLLKSFYLTVFSPSVRAPSKQVFSSFFSEGATFSFSCNYLFRSFLPFLFV